MNEQRRYSAAASALLAAIGAAALITPARAADVSAYLTAVDRNGDEHVSLDELANAPALANLFSAADEDGNGLLDAQEFEQLLRMPTLERPDG